ncbi:relaxase [uncultured Hoeflea sp.]|uniref:relaxase/mobilization nuclease domain-containing protein n=1 Tax=uncultured Hoeflea sp. TaxID=538666 RepID=UPI002605A8BA|nr:relaxase [uncultured Hoeflea sp.]
MILKGNQRAHGRELALHLLNVDDNEHAVVHELRGFLAEDLIGAFKEVEAVSLGTRCRQYLFSMSLNPPSTASVPIDAFETAINDIERRLGLTSQPRAIVFHEKHGRRHAHCVWSRINVARMRAINLPHYKRRLMDVSRELFMHHEWDMPAGLVNPEDRDRANYTHEEAGQAKRACRDPIELKALFRDCWERSDCRSAFDAALREHGLVLARGDRRGFVALDAQGNVYALSRWCSVKAREMRERLGSFEDLPRVQDALELLQSNRLISEGVDRDRLEHQAIHAVGLDELVARQREERRRLASRHEQRWTDEAFDRLT